MVRIAVFCTWCLLPFSYEYRRGRKRTFCPMCADESIKMSITRTCPECGGPKSRTGALCRSCSHKVRIDAKKHGKIGVSDSQIQLLRNKNIEVLASKGVTSKEVCIATTLRPTAAYLRQVVEKMGWERYLPDALIHLQTLVQFYHNANRNRPVPSLAAAVFYYSLPNYGGVWRDLTQEEVAEAFGITAHTLRVTYKPYAKYIGKEEMGELKIFTIGFTKKTLARFCELLTENGVDLLLDIRLRPRSQLAGFAKQQDLKYITEHFLKIKYLHASKFAPSDELLEKYRKRKQWNIYEREYLASIQTKVALFRSLIGRHHRVCLLCSEHQPDKCHRRLLAELMASRLSKKQLSVTVHHLV